MMESFLNQRLRTLFQRQQFRRIGWELAAVWMGGVLCAGFALLLARSQGWTATRVVPLLVVLTASVAVWFVIRRFMASPDFRSLALRVEKSDPELKGLILTAVQQSSDSEGRPASFLQQELLSAAIASGSRRHWRDLVPMWHIVASHLVQLMALAGLVLVLVKVDRVLPRVAAERAAVSAGLSVTPGNTEIERGETLVVLARFGGSVPGNVDLLVNESGKAEKRIPLVKSLSDPVFGGTLAEVSDDLRYRVAYGDEVSPEYSVRVFEFPRLERPDAYLTFPAYTRLEPKRIEDTRRLSAVEGTLIGLTLQLNKAVIDARLIARDKGGTVIPLLPAGDKAVATLPARIFSQSMTYDLRLTDSDGRMNKLPTPFVIEVQPNRRPELRLLSPRGDLRPSVLEEISFEGTVWDDFGSPAYGLAYSQGGGDMTVIELGRDAGAKERRSFNYLLRLEDLHVKPDALIS
ncbi:MAG: hypothetical protein KBA71_08910, partial [Opitutaceae bacterium]|nr:hypothetical protein [Opitutaceae bacterium]